MLRLTAASLTRVRRGGVIGGGRALLAPVSSQRGRRGKAAAAATSDESESDRRAKLAKNLAAMLGGPHRPSSNAGAAAGMDALDDPSISAASSSALITPPQAAASERASSSLDVLDELASAVPRPSAARSGGRRQAAQRQQTKRPAEAAENFLDDDYEYGEEDLVSHDYVRAEDGEGAQDADALPPTAVVAATTPAATPRASRSRRTKKTVEVAIPDEAEAAIPDEAEAAGEGGSSLSLPTSPALANPFKGIHACVTRSYRLDQLLHTSTAEDLLFARQEKKSGAFSFMQFKAGTGLYEGHWGSLEELRGSQLQLMFPGYSPAEALKKLEAAKGGVAVPGYTLFNNNLGLFDPCVAHSAPLLLAQRLLMFPDSARHFHALCGRECVPCDFFADVDLPDTTPVEAEKVLLEILNYLEVRLPGVGFTDPLFLVLTNDVPYTDKVSYHIHARSMTYLREEADISLAALHSSFAAEVAATDGGAGASTSKRKEPKKQKRRVGKGSKAEDAQEAARAAEENAEEDDDDDDADEDDDLTDLVNVVDNTPGGKGTAQGKAKKKNVVPRVIAFHDYRTVKLIGDEVNQTVGKAVIDDGCYRKHGMLRCAFSSKINAAGSHDRLLSGGAGTRRRMVPLITAVDKALRQKLSLTEEVLRTLTDPQILELTFCNRYLDTTETMRAVQRHAKEVLPVRPRGAEEKAMTARVLRAAHRHRYKLIRPRHILGPQSAQAVEYDVYGNAVSPFLTEAAKWRRYTAAVQKLRTLPTRAADTYDVWVRVGLALHNFSNEDHVFEEWVRFSLKSPQKYSREACRRKWIQFERNPDALNWRRGYNYLNSTIWRQV